MYIMYESSLAHHGIKGQRWGVRRYQNKDGTLTEKGKKRYDLSDDVIRSDYRKAVLNSDKSDEDIPKTKKAYDTRQRETMKKVAIGVAIAAGVGVGIYCAYKYNALNRIKDGIDDLDGKTDPTSIRDIAKKAMLDAQKDSDIVFKSGQVFHRMTAESGLDFSKKTTPTYVSYKKLDVYKYMTQLKDWSGTGKRYDVTLEAVKDIRMPSKETAKSLFNELWNNDPSYRRSLMDTLTQTYTSMLEKQHVDHQKAAQLAFEHAKKALSSDPFNSAIYSIVRQSSDSKTLIDTFKKAGYDAIEDYFDKGSFTDSPVILFDASSSVVKRGEQFVTDEMKRYAEVALRASGKWFSP